jgi:SnoaL-like domain
MHPTLETQIAHARGVDRGDRDLLRSCYHPDAIEEHGGRYTGNAYVYIDEAVKRIQSMGPMQHLLGSSHIELQGDMARVETYVLTFYRPSTTAGDLDTLTGGRLLDRFERRNGEWKIAHRRTVFDWNRDTPARQGWVNGMFQPGAPGMLVGCKGADDPSYSGW